MKTVNPYCPFALKDKKLKKAASRKRSGAPFRCTGYCKFDGCPMKFKIEGYGKKVKVFMTDRLVKHIKGQKKSRQITGSKRLSLARALKYNSPSSMYHASFNKLSVSELCSGNRDKIGSSPEVYRKISSEAKQSELPSIDLVSSLSILRKKLTPNHQKIAGYIQRISAFSFSVTLFTEVGVRLYHNQAPRSTLFCDATGTITSLKKCLQWSNDKTLYYALVFGGHKASKSPPVAVAEFITTEHSVMAVSHFLESFRYSEGLIYGFKNICMPIRVVIDRSLVLLPSFLRMYNFETLSDYLHRCFRIANNCCDPSDTSKMFVHACTSHCMKSARTDLQKIL